MNTCLNCGQKFLPPFGRRSDYCCDECRKEAKRKSHRIAQKKYSEKLKQLDKLPRSSISKQSSKNLDEEVKEIEIYNKLHGTRYTYGDWQRLQFFGKV